MSHKVMDKKNRWRSKTVSFRVSPEEWTDIERLVRISGLSKQDYIMHRLQDKEINVTANPRVVKAIRDELRKVIDTVKDVKTADDALVDTINIPHNASDIDTEDRNILLKNYIKDNFQKL